MSPKIGTPHARIEDQLIAELPRLRRFCAGLAGNADAGDDLLQATVERALAHADQWQDGTRLDSWLLRIARNHAIDMARSRKVRGTAVDLDTIADLRGEDGQQIVEGRSELAAVGRAFDGLSMEHKAVMALVVINGCSYREAAEALDIPIGSVMSRLARARAAICARMHLTGAKR
ncbi:MAG: RNA polymerase sigma factor [Sphingopyxis sp.]